MMQLKAIDIKIINISTIMDEKGRAKVFGLGEDGNVYYWLAVHSYWILFIEGERSDSIGEV